jgi:hypothetical protein
MKDMIMRPLSLLLLVTLILPVTFVAQGQITDQIAAWRVVQQCFESSSQQQGSVSFNGTLVLRSLGRLHAFRSEWETPRILAFFHEVDTALSPDNRWFAIVEGGSRVNGMVTEFSTSTIRVVNTLDGSEYSLPWENTYSGVHRIDGHRIYWLNNDQLLYSIGDFDELWFQINPFLGETQPWQAHFTPSHFAFVLAPNGEYGLSSGWPEPLWTLHTPNSDIVVDTEVGYGSNAWNPLGLYLVGVGTTQPTGSETLVTVTLQGEIDEVVYRAESPETRIRQLHWSPDGRYLAFLAEQLLIADTERQIIVDTCIASPSQGYLSMSWSQASSQLALLAPYDSKREIHVLDLENATETVVGYHSGEVIGWRAD